MERDVLQSAASMLKKRKLKKRWKNVVSIFAAVIVFYTTYVLILPAITMEKETFCGLEEHEHVETCYGVKTYSFLNCTEMLEGSEVVHKHNEFCIDTEGNMCCTLEEREAHVHDESCYVYEDVCICTLPEVSEHILQRNVIPS